MNESTKKRLSLFTCTCRGYFVALLPSFPKEEQTKEGPTIWVELFVSKFGCNRPVLNLACLSTDKLHPYLNTTIQPLNTYIRMSSYSHIGNKYNWFTYIDKSFILGLSSNLEQRIIKHMIEESKHLSSGIMVVEPLVGLDEPHTLY